MFVEAITSEIINGVKHVVKHIKYANGMRVRRLYSPEGVHLDSLIVETREEVKPKD